MKDTCYREDITSSTTSAVSSINPPRHPLEVKYGLPDINPNCEHQRTVRETMLYVLNRIESDPTLDRTVRL